MSSTLIVPLVLLGTLLVTVWWVCQDATTHARAGEPVVLWSASFRLETPSAVGGGMLGALCVFFPLYLRARQRTI